MQQGKLTHLYKQNSYCCYCICAMYAYDIHCSFAPRQDNGTKNIKHYPQTNYALRPIACLLVHRSFPLPGSDCPTYLVTMKER